MKFTKLSFQVPIAVDVGDNIRDSKNDDVFVSLILGKQCFLNNKLCEEFRTYDFAFITVFSTNLQN